MFKNINIKTCLIFAAVAAVVYIIPVILFVDDASYKQTWLLYLGNMFFFVVVAVYNLFYNKRKSGNPSTVTSVFAGHIVTIAGILISCLLAVVVLIFMVPGLFGSGDADKVLLDAPANTIDGNTNGLTFKVIVNAIVGNMSFGSFASIIFPFYAKLNQTKDTREPSPLQNNASS